MDDTWLVDHYSSNLANERQSNKTSTREDPHLLLNKFALRDSPQHLQQTATKIVGPSPQQTEGSSSPKKQAGDRADNAPVSGKLNHHPGKHSNPPGHHPKNGVPHWGHVGFSFRAVAHVCRSERLQKRRRHVNDTWLVDHFSSTRSRCPARPILCQVKNGFAADHACFGNCHVKKSLPPLCGGVKPLSRPHKKKDLHVHCERHRQSRKDNHRPWSPLPYCAPSNIGVDSSQESVSGVTARD